MCSLQSFSFVVLKYRMCVCVYVCVCICVCIYTGGTAGGGEAEVRGPQIRTNETRVGMCTHTHTHMIHGEAMLISLGTRGSQA
jgi:hypothetical protein